MVNCLGTVELSIVKLGLVLGWVAVSDEILNQGPWLKNLNIETENIG